MNLKGSNDPGRRSPDLDLKLELVAELLADLLADQVDQLEDVGRTGLRAGRR